MCLINCAIVRMRTRSHHQVPLRARSSRQQELPFPTNAFPVLKEPRRLMAPRPALEHLLAALLQSSEEAVVTLSPKGTIETWSAGAERLYGYGAEEIIGESVGRVLPVYESPRLESLLSQRGDEGRLVELGERVHKNGSRILLAIRRSVIRGVVSHFEYDWKSSVLEIRVGPLRSSSGQIMGCLGVALDVTDRKKTEEQARYQARHDGLTGLANYREFMDRLEREVRRAERSHRSFALLLLDLDELKRINDLQGHLAGNRALRRLAAVMNEHCRSTDLAARYGGDEFAVILIDSDRRMAENVAQRIERRLHSEQNRPQLSVSIGIGVYPDDGRTPAEMIEAADQRLYRRKKDPTQRGVSAR